MNILGLELDFDITSPNDVMRYKKAGEQMEARSANLTKPTVDADDANYLEQYIEMLNQELKIFGDFIDEVFGEGTANQLLGTNPSLMKITEVNDALVEAFEAQGKNYGAKLKKYTPNRAAKRAKK